MNVSRGPYLFDEGVESLPDWAEELERAHSVEFRWVENLGPYRKLIPLWNEIGERDVVVTVDDDAIYGRGWLELLLAAAEDDTEAIIAGRARWPVYNAWGVRQSYLNWPVEESSGRSVRLVPIGVAGVLYRRYHLASEFLGDRAFLELCPTADDIWFKAASWLKGSPARVVPEVGREVHEIQSPKGLWRDNARPRRSMNNRLVAATSGGLARARGYFGWSVVSNDRAIANVEELLATRYRKKGFLLEE